MRQYEEANDPLEPMNRAIFAFNQVADRYVIKPVAEAYVELPQGLRDSIRNFLRNLKTPIILANDLLQGEGRRAGETLTRFLVNSTAGVLGLFDVAAANGVPYHDEDFGQTLAVWGVGEGPYLVLPILGPSNFRDTAGMAADWLADPVRDWAEDHDKSWANWTRTGLRAIDLRAELLETLDKLERTSLDYYAALRSMTRQRRDAEIRNGARDQPGAMPKIEIEDDDDPPPQRK
ncbi:MAG: VacJ family lipoprotein [Alphaproteobacteria bacterium]|nr:VacJ family lipoprotein [Alphaproteobacteria bacterium]